MSTNKVVLQKGKKLDFFNASLEPWLWSSSSVSHREMTPCFYLIKQLMRQNEPVDLLGDGRQSSVPLCGDEMNT